MGLLKALPSKVVEKVFSHASRIEDLHLKGNTVDVDLDIDVSESES
jgi:hypothetical protein